MVSHEVAVRILVGLPSSEVHSHGRWQEASVPHCVGLSCWLANPRANGLTEWGRGKERRRERKRGRERKASRSYSVFHKESWRCHAITSAIVYWSHRLMLVQYRRGLHKSGNAGRRDHWRPAWRLATTFAHLFCQGDVIMHILYITNESGQHTLSIFKFPDPKLTVWSDKEIQM